MFAITIWWAVSAHKWFKGPKVNVEHMMLGRNVVEGEERKGADSGSDIAPAQATDSKRIGELGVTDKGV